MTNYETLEILYDRLMNRLHDISMDWRFEVPKRGCEREHEQTHEMAECIRDMMQRYQKEEGR